MKNENSSQSTITPLKKFTFGVVFVCLILLTFEFVLGFLNLEEYDKKFMPKSTYPIFIPGKGDMTDYYVTSPHFGAYINKQSFLRKKPTDLTRIFVVGGSAAFGFPYNAEHGFSGYLDRALNKAFPGKFEVINASGMSFGSHRVLDVLKDVVLFEPDLVIIYSGNNEYVEQNILPETKKAPAAMEKISSHLSQTDIYRAIRLTLFKVNPKTFESRIKQDITDIRSDPQVRRGDIGRSQNTDSTILANYKNNITAMKELLVQNGVKAILCTVPVDIGGWLPTSGLPQFSDKAAAQRWLDLIDEREAAFQKGDIAQEAEYMQQILEITPNDPGMLFNYGKVLWLLGKYETSYQVSVNAKDYDYRPIRALSSFNEVIRSTVDEQKGVYLADLENNTKEKYLQGNAKGIFLDYCHFTETGHKLVAQWLLPVLNKAIKSSQLDIASLSELIRVDPRAKTKSDFVRGHELYAQALTFENNHRFDLAEKTYLQALTYLPVFDQIYTNLGHIYVDQNRMTKAVEMYNKALEINPNNHKVLLALGYFSLQEKRYGDAEKYFVTALNITSILPGAYSGLGDVAMHRGKFQEAVKYYNESLRLGQDSVWLRQNLAKAYLSLDDTNNAVRNWEEVLKFSPLNQETKALIEKHKQMQ